MVSENILVSLVAFVGAGLVLFGVVLVGAVILRAAAKWAERLDLAFWPSVVTVVAYTAANVALGLVVAALAGMIGPGPKHGMLQGLATPVGFLLQSAVISGRHHVSFLKGIKISFFMWLVTVLLGIAIAVVTIGVIAVMPRF